MRLFHERFAVGRVSADHERQVIGGYLETESRADVAVIDGKGLDNEIVLFQQDAGLDGPGRNPESVGILYRLKTAGPYLYIHRVHFPHTVRDPLDALRPPGLQPRVAPPPHRMREFGKIHGVVAMQMREEHAADQTRIKRRDVVLVAGDDCVSHRSGAGVEQVTLALVNDGYARARAKSVGNRCAGSEYDHAGGSEQFAFGRRVPQFGPGAGKRDREFVVPGLA